MERNEFLLKGGKGDNEREETTNIQIIIDDGNTTREETNSRLGNIACYRNNTVSPITSANQNLAREVNISLPSTPGSSSGLPYSRLRNNSLYQNSKITEGLPDADAILSLRQLNTKKSLGSKAFSDYNFFQGMGGSRKYLIDRHDITKGEETLGDHKKFLGKKEKSVEDHLDGLIDGEVDVEDDGEIEENESIDKWKEDISTKDKNFHPLKEGFSSGIEIPTIVERRHKNSDIDGQQDLLKKKTFEEQTENTLAENLEDALKCNDYLTFSHHGRFIRDFLGDFTDMKEVEDRVLNVEAVYDDILFGFKKTSELFCNMKRLLARASKKLSRAIAGFFWFMQLLWKEFLIVILVCTYAKTQPLKGILHDLESLMNSQTILISLLLAFRANIAYDRYINANEQVFQICNKLSGILVEMYGYQYNINRVKINSAILPPFRDQNLSDHANINLRKDENHVDRNSTTTATISSTDKNDKVTSHEAKLSQINNLELCHAENHSTEQLSFDTSSLQSNSIHITNGDENSDQDHNEKQITSSDILFQKCNEVEWDNVLYEMRRKCNILFAFIRQHLRESSHGFNPNSKLGNFPFNSTTFVQDPVRPRLWDLLYPDEYSIYSLLDPISRVNMVTEEIHILAYRYSLMTTELIILGIRDNLKDIRQRFQTLNRIQATPTPYPYVIVLDIIIYFYIVISPFTLKSDSVIYISPLLLCFMFLGVKKVCNLLENPFGWTFFDVPFEKMSLQLHNLLHNAAVFGSSRVFEIESFIPEDRNQDAEEIDEQTNNIKGKQNV